MLKVKSEVMGRGVPVLGVTLQRAVNDLLQLRRDRRINFPRRHWIIEQPIIHDQKSVLAREWHFPCQHLIENDAQSIKVAASIAALAFELLWRNIIRCPHRLGKLGESKAARLGIGCNAEVN